MTSKSETEVRRIVKVALRAGLSPAETVEEDATSDEQAAIDLDLREELAAARTYEDLHRIFDEWTRERDESGYVGDGYRGWEGTEELTANQDVLDAIHEALPKHEHKTVWK